MIAATQTKEHEEDKHTGIRHEKIRKTVSKTQSQEIVLKAFMVTNLPASATKPSRGPCHTICHLIPALVDNDIKCHCCSFGLFNYDSYASFRASGVIWGI